MSENSDQEMNSQSHDDNEPSILDWLKFSFLKLFRKRSTDPENIRINSLRKEPESCREGDLNEISIPDQKNVEGNSSGGGDNAGEQFFSINFPVPQRTHIELIVDTTEIKEDGKVISLQFSGLDSGDIQVRGSEDWAKYQIIKSPLPSSAKSDASTSTRNNWEIHAQQLFNDGWLYFSLALLIYLITRLIGLEEFPIYFFTDEAIHTNLAETLVINKLTYQGELLPTYFPVGASYGLNSVTVYIHTIPYILFGKSIFITRATSVFITLIGAVAISFIVREYFKSPYWWSALLILSITPTWFLHSRTAFENVSVASFYACFLYFYLRYRVKSQRAIYLAVIFGGLCFYSHGLGQFLMAIIGILLIFSDLRYHIANWRYVLSGAFLLVLVLLPYFRFVFNDSTIFQEQMRQRASYWTDSSINIVDKFILFFRNYLIGFNPIYWFSPSPGIDLDRHIMKGYGHFSIPSGLFFFWGLFQSIKNFRSPTYRIIIISLLATPFGAAFTEVTILRAIWFVVPATILITLGLSNLLTRIEVYRITRRLISVSLFFILAAVNVFMLINALYKGPLWYQDYTLYGMQYGTKQLFGEKIPEILQHNPNYRVVVSPTWANGTDNFKNFFLSDAEQARVSFNTVEAYLYEQLPVDENLILVMTPDEYQLALRDPKFESVETVALVNYPDGRPGFYFGKVSYVDNVTAMFTKERIARKQLIKSEVSTEYGSLVIDHSMIDMGSPAALFDGDFYSLMRGLEANPLILDINFQDPLTLSGIAADFANMDFTVKAYLYDVMKSDPIVYQQSMTNVDGDPHFELLFENPQQHIKRLRLEIYSHTHGERAHIHIRELDFLP